MGLDEPGDLWPAERLAPAPDLAGAEELGHAVGPRLDETGLVLPGLDRADGGPIPVKDVRRASPLGEPAFDRLGRNEISARGGKNCRVR